ncbi:MAG: hypothetical protein HKO81_06180 [Flavobacteriaceae bacterium]|nr:hypothetical protein [Flavobacteriaceae bacterium]
MKYIGLLILFFSITATMAQEDKLPYHEIPDYPDVYNACTVAARMIDGLGFRYYWATEGLRDKDLSYKPNEEARTTDETIDHIFRLSRTILNSTLNIDNRKNDGDEILSFKEKREQTLLNLKTSADILRDASDLSQFKLIFGATEFPFWNNINGPIEDAIWHCGQIVSFRRSSGNPFNSKASLFTGKLKD